MFRRLLRVVLAVAVLLTIPATAAAFAVSAHNASTERPHQPAAALPTLRAGTAACAMPSVWDGASTGRGVTVRLHHLKTPGPVTVTVVYTSGETTRRTRTLASGVEDLRFSFRRVHPDEVEAVFAESGTARCEVDSLDDFLLAGSDR
ncbi:hypothetical protein [Nocardia pseudobrasiliensis]|uniref:Secreted protein n=1 Tax=Nocardia pseudobrasiliensis TaxID=45979 RepID=A0A370I5H9_9NOCA|nr:hypothetical protein [Nocardia pseudobrasiliensis]RDI65985.1 hypothetical protein DFR76_105304 [Nocardia pseudobrasiliensis]